MLEQIAHFNDLSPKLKKELEGRIASYGKKVKYKFAISNTNPDPLKENGPIIWPAFYTLDPVVFDIVDTLEDRENKSRSKKIGMVEKVDEKGIPTAFKRVRVHGKMEGVYVLELDDPDQIRQAMYIELHPKFDGGLFQDKKRIAIVSRLDEKKVSKEARENRNAKVKALKSASEMSEQKVRQFAAAMVWDELGDIEILRDKIEALAESDPSFFNDLVSEKKVEYQATVKRAITNGVIAYDPVGGKFRWGANQQVITVLGLGSAQNEVEQFAEFLMTNGAKADEIYKKIEGLVKV